MPDRILEQTMTLHTFDLAPITISLDASSGHIAGLTVSDGERTLTPLHRAPWVDDPAVTFPPDTPLTVQRLSGDFFCAPFGRNDVEEAPLHGWPSNSSWEHIGTTQAEKRLQAAFRLSRLVMGATVEKRITLVEGHPFIYQEHRFIGGAGAVSAAHHVMVHMQEGGELAFSPKTYAVTPPEALEPDPARGRSVLAYPARTPDLTAFPLANGGTADLTRYPPASSHEDFLTLVEQRGRSLGWSCITRRAETDRVIILKQPQVLPVTMLWFSNGGRDYAPWSGRHSGVLGIEDARASPLGHAASIADNDFNRDGVKTAFALGEAREVVVRQVIGACRVAPGEGAVRDVTTGANNLTLHFDNAATRTLPFDPAYLG